MRIRHLVHEVRSALHVSKVSCELSDADLEALVRDGIEEVGNRRHEHRIVECALAKARHACDEIRAWRAGATAKSARKRRRILTSRSRRDPARAGRSRT